MLGTQNDCGTCLIKAEPFEASSVALAHATDKLDASQWLLMYNDTKTFIKLLGYGLLFAAATVCAWIVDYAVHKEFTMDAPKTLQREIYEVHLY